MGCDLADGLADHCRSGGGSAGGHTGGHRAARRRDTVQRRAARKHHSDRLGRNSLRRSVGDGQRLEPGDPVDLVGDTASGPAGQGDDCRRHGVTAAARTWAGHPHLASDLGVGVLRRHHVDVGIVDGHGHRSRGTGKRATEFGGQLGRQDYRDSTRSRLRSRPSTSTTSRACTPRRRGSQNG
jgi:hypothetical protein